MQRLVPIVEAQMSFAWYQIAVSGAVVAAERVLFWSSKEEVEEEERSSPPNVDLHLLLSSHH